MTPKCPDCKRDQDDCICASPASVPVAFYNTMRGTVGVKPNTLPIEAVARTIPLYAAAPTPPVSEDRWQSIETAPKYGRFLAVMPSGVMSVIVWLEASHPDADGEGWYEHWKFDPVDPTHWMPLPKAPAMQEDKP